MRDILNEKTGVLYCSLKCFNNDGSSQLDLMVLRQNDYRQSEYGALCPICEVEYHSFANDEYGLQD